MKKIFLYLLIALVIGLASCTCSKGSCSKGGCGKSLKSKCAAGCTASCSKMDEMKAMDGMSCGATMAKCGEAKCGEGKCDTGKCGEGKCGE